MSNVAISVNNLGKQYRIGGQQEGYRTLRETLSDAMVGPFQRAARLFRGEGTGSGRSSDTIWALHDVSFDVNQGEVVGIIGRNGAGKSTLLKILSRITEPTLGYADIVGRVGSLLEVGTGFHPELTGRENIYLNGAILGMNRSEIERKFDEVVAFAEIEKFINTPVKHYSSGMYMRLAFAVAAHLEPEILMVDEVLAVGDAAFQKKCLGKMSEVAGEGRTVLFVSHNMGAISSLSTKVVYLEKGRVRSVGATDTIIADYLSEVFQNETEGLDHLRVAGFGKEARFKDIKLMSGDGSNLFFGEPIKYALTVESDVAFRGVSLGCSVFDSSGACVGTLFTKETFSIGANEQVELVLTVSNLTLAPGSYYNGFSLGRGGHDGGRYDLDVVAGKPAFQVLPVSQEKDFLAGWHPNWGSIVITDTHLAVNPK